jgi:transcriptional regulator with XRE-family HTH domain
MVRKRTHEKTPFARWLTRARTRAKLTQDEAVKRMKQLGKGVRVETWSRWECGVRPVPRTKIDAVADSVGVRREVARRHAGYNVPIMPERIKREGVLAAMLRVLSSNLQTEDKVLEIYALGSGYFDTTDPQFNIKEMQRAAYLFDNLKKLTQEQRTEAWERINQLVAEAKGKPATSFPVEEAAIIFKKRGIPPVTLGTEVIIEYPEEWQSYVVKKIEEKGGNLVATIVASGS